MAVFLILAYGILSLAVVLGPGAAYRMGIDRFELLLLLGIMALGPIAFLVRRRIEQKREAANSATTERYIQTPAFQHALHTMMMQRPPHTGNPGDRE